MSNGSDSAAARVLTLIGDASRDLGPGPHRAALEAVAERLQGPLRVAIAGRVKAGKSTLLNALVGERLAPTDAGECTKLVSRYQHGPSYHVAAELHTGEHRPLAFRRDDGELRVQLGGLTENEVNALDVSWPSTALQSVTLIDTPGLASINDENSRRTRDFLESDRDHAPEADAVIYLMRHLHKSDVAFLDAFMDRSVSSASPVHSVAVLSRADEIGAGRLDALQSAGRIADRYRRDETVRTLASNVVPIAGLLAETGLTFREDEAAALRSLAAEDGEILDDMLLSAEQFCAPEASDLTVEIRRSLLERLGLFGARFAVGEIRSGRATTAAALAPLLVETSGLNELRSIIEATFLPRARVLKARSALAALRNLGPELRVLDTAVADRIERDVERIEASAVEFARMRAATLVATSDLRVSDDERAELERLFLSPSSHRGLGVDPSAPVEVVRSAALETIGRWRQRASDPLADPTLIEVCETAARTGESYFAATGA